MVALRQAEGSVSVPELCPEHGISTASFYNWRSNEVWLHGCVDDEPDEALKDENRRLKRHVRGSEYAG